MRILLLLMLAAGVRDIPERRELKAPQEFQGFPCDAGYAWFFSDGRLASCFLSREAYFGELKAPAKSWIHLNHEGETQYVFLAHDAVVMGYRCRGGGHDFSTVLYPDGKLKTFWLEKDAVVDGVPCMKAGFIADVFGGGVAVNFHENGRLESCKLSRDFSIGGKVYRSGDHVRLDANGKPLPSAVR